PIHVYVCNRHEVDPNNEDKGNEFTHGKGKVCGIEEGGEFVGQL
ncbi:hypothetical protein Tco_0378467, partial [Tanacetum coccineum]